MNIKYVKPRQGCQVQKNLKGQILKNEKKAKQRPNFLQKFVNITKLEFRISEFFSQICKKQALKYTIFINIQKGQKMAKTFYFWQTVSKKGHQHPKKAKKWPKHFISGKQFQKRPNGNPVPRVFRKKTFFLWIGKNTVHHS